MELYHYGVPKRSGRYPYGSGERPYQGESTKKIVKRINKLSKKKAFAYADEENRKARSKRASEASKQAFDDGRLAEALRIEDDSFNDLMAATDFAAKYVQYQKEFDGLIDEVKKRGLTIDAIDEQRVWRRYRGYGTQVGVKTYAATKSNNKKQTAKWR